MLTTAEASLRLKLSEEQVRRLVRNGQLTPVHRTGPGRNSHFRITEEAIDAYLKRHTFEPAQAAS